MKKIFLYVILGLLWCNVGVAEEHEETFSLEELFKGEKKKEFKFKDEVSAPEEWKATTVNTYTKDGYKIIDVQQQSGMLFYTLQKSRRVIVCTVITLGPYSTRCFAP